MVMTAAAAAAAAGCGGSAGDILALELPRGGDRGVVRLTVTEDGRGTCDGDRLEPIPSARLIEAREVVRELESLAAAGAVIPAPAGRRRPAYAAHTPAGTVRWAPDAHELPPVLARAAELGEELRSDLCRPAGTG